MKKVFLIASALLCTYGVFGQGTVVFNNRVAGTFSGAQAPLAAPIYGVDSADNRAKTGNTSTGVPQGSTTYGGALLLGSGYTIQLWGIGSSLYTTDASLQLVPGSTSSFRTSTSGAGLILAGLTVAVPNAAADSTAVLQVRAWDNKGGTVNNWAAVLADPNIARGQSANITSFPLGGGTTQPPNMVGLQSFQLFTIVPEPSTIALALAGGLGLLFMRRRNK
jgi:hypothetical protein